MAEKKTINGKAAVEKKVTNGAAVAAKKAAVRKAAAPKLAAQKVPNRKEFVSPAKQEFTIRNGEGTIGHLLVKPNGIAWKKKGQQTYKQVSLDVFAKLAEETGRDVKQ